MSVSILLLALSSQLGQQSGNVIKESGLLGLSCVVAFVVSMAILGIVLAAIKDDKADQIYRQ